MLVPPSPAAHTFTTRDRPHNDPHNSARPPGRRGGRPPPGGCGTGRDSVGQAGSGGLGAGQRRGHRPTVPGPDTGPPGPASETTADAADAAQDKLPTAGRAAPGAGAHVSGPWSPPGPGRPATGTVARPRGRGPDRRVPPGRTPWTV